MKNLIDLSCATLQPLDMHALPTSAIIIFTTFSVMTVIRCIYIYRLINQHLYKYMVYILHTQLHLINVINIIIKLCLIWANIFVNQLTFLGMSFVNEGNETNFICLPMKRIIMVANIYCGIKTNIISIKHFSIYLIYNPLVTLITWPMPRNWYDGNLEKEKKMLKKLMNQCHVIILIF